MFPGNRNSFLKPLFKTDLMAMRQNLKYMTLVNNSQLNSINSVDAETGLTVLQERHESGCPCLLAYGTNHLALSAEACCAVLTRLHLKLRYTRTTTLHFAMHCVCA